MSQKLDPVFRDILNALMPPDIGPEACARDAQYAPVTSRAQQLVLAADRQYIDAATARIRELEELVAHQERHIQELLDQLFAISSSAAPSTQSVLMPKLPDALEALNKAYHTLHPNQYMGLARVDAEQAKEAIGQAIELLGGVP